MGYTHYWYRPAEIERATFDRIVADFMRMVPVLRNAGVPLADGCGEGDPVVTFDEVCFNGVQDCGHPANHEVVLSWPSEHAGGVMGNGDAIDGDWGFGTTVQHRCCNGDCSYETFDFPRNVGDVSNRTRYEGNLFFDFCKTSFRPYDLAVNVFLIIAKHHMGAGLIVRSDGEAPQWFDAKLLCAGELGYGLEFAPTIERPRELPDDPTPPASPAALAARSMTVTERAKALREGLKKEYPGVKFSVTCSRGGSINVKWTDGPAYNTVKDLAGQMETVNYDQFGEILCGGNTFVFCNREIGPELERKAMDAAHERYGIPNIPPSLLDYNDHRLYYQVVSEMAGDMPEAKRAKAHHRSRSAESTSPAPAPTTSPAQNPLETTTAPVQATFLRTSACSWLKFAGPLPVALEKSLRSAGWEHSDKRQAWYHRQHANPPAGISYLQNAG